MKASDKALNKKDLMKDIEEKLRTIEDESILLTDKKTYLDAFLRYAGNVVLLKYLDERFDSLLLESIGRFFAVFHRATDRDVICTCLQAFSIIVENSKSRTVMEAIYKAILSTKEFDVWDEQLLSYYISLFKTISLRIDRDQVNLFFPNDGSSNIFNKVCKYYHRVEGMLKVSIQTVILNFLQVMDPYFMEKEMTHKEHFRGVIEMISQKLEKTNPRDIFEDVLSTIDELYYLHDILNLKNKPQLVNTIVIWLLELLIRHGHSLIEFPKILILTEVLAILKHKHRFNSNFVVFTNSIVYYIYEVWPYRRRPQTEIEKNSESILVLVLNQVEAANPLLEILFQRIKADAPPPAKEPTQITDPFVLVYKAQKKLSQLFLHMDCGSKPDFRHILPKGENSIHLWIKSIPPAEYELFTDEIGELFTQHIKSPVELLRANPEYSQKFVRVWNELLDKSRTTTTVESLSKVIEFPKKYISEFIPESNWCRSDPVLQKIVHRTHIYLGFRIALDGKCKVHHLKYKSGANEEPSRSEKERCLVDGLECTIEMRNEDLVILRLDGSRVFSNKINDVSIETCAEKTQKYKRVFTLLSKDPSGRKVTHTIEIYKPQIEPLRRYHSHIMEQVISDFECLQMKIGNGHSQQ